MPTAIGVARRDAPDPSIGKAVQRRSASWVLVPRRRMVDFEFELPARPHGEAVLCLGLLGLTAGCNIELTLRNAANVELWRRAPREPVARLRTATWRDIAISLARRTSAGLLFEATARAKVGAPLAPLFYELPADRMPSGGKVRLSMRRLMSPPVLLTHVSLTTTSSDPAERVPHEQPLQAYVNRIGVTPGDLVELMVHAPARRFDLAIIRYGRADRIMIEAHDIPGDAQTRPRAAYHLGAGWPVAWQCVVDDMFEAGLYGVRLSDPAGGVATVPLLVRRAVPGAGVLILASTNTWTAYNDWGGASTYHWYKDDALGRDRARVVSRSRPNPAADPDRGDGHLARGLAELLRWMDRSGYANDLATDEDAHADPTLFDRYRCLITDSHAEYWTAEMRGALERFLARGGALAYLSGDGIYWKTHATADGIEVVKPWGVFSNGDTGGLWADLGAPASKLTCVEYTPAGANTYAPYRVVRPDHWIFAGTGVAAGSMFGERGAFGAASGHETDKMNRHTPKGTVLLARGTNPHNGGAHMTYFAGADGRQVFSAGSIPFIGALADDLVIGRMMRNVLDRFLAEPP